MVDYYKYLNAEHYVSIDSTSIQPQPAITCSQLAIETLEQGVKYVQS